MNSTGLNPNQLITLQLFPSLFILGWLWLVFSMVALGILFTEMPLWANLILDLLLVLGFVHCIKNWFLLAHNNSITVLEWQEKVGKIHFKDGRVVEVVLADGTFVTSLLTGLMLKPKRGGKRYRVNLFPDSADREQIRLLRIALRTGVASKDLE